ncbi:MAG: DUF429 domain-containing protein [Pyrinomonadaceae bacterium]|nr:DUF429 domain-containing protein [Pyrinomonadaceae bacterium]
MITTTFIGIDLAWQSDRNPTGVAVLQGDREGAELTTLQTISPEESVAEFVSANATADTVVAIDAPLIIVNETGQRGCETAVGQRYGSRDASCHSSNLHLFPGSTSVALTAELASLGFLHVDPLNPQRQGRIMAEVYPHAAMVALWDLPKTIKYKKGTVAEKRLGLNTFRTYLSGLGEAKPPLHRSTKLNGLLTEELNQLSGRKLKDHEDQLDALFCAYLAYYFWYWRWERNEVFGDLESGYILNPKLQLGDDKSDSLGNQSDSRSTSHDSRPAIQGSLFADQSSLSAIADSPPATRDTSVAYSDIIAHPPQLARPIKRSDAYRTFDTYLAGVMHDERYLVIPQLSLREPVQLRREPDNPSDANAILVETQNGQQVGYIRRELASYLAPQINEEAQPIQATVTELSSDAGGSAYRVRVNFSVPAAWLNRQETLEPSDDQPTEYTYDDSGSSVYVLLNSSEERFNQVREKMTAENISYTRNGLSYRSAHNGRPYQWYIRIERTKEMNKGLIEEFFKRNFNVAPEFELLGLLEESKKRFESELQELRLTLKEAKDYANLAGEIDAESRRLKQQLQQRIGDLEFQVKTLEGEVRQIDDEKRGLIFDNKKLKTFPIFSNPGDRADAIPDVISDLLEDVISETLTPKQSLLVIKGLFPARIEVLDSAFESANESKSFRHKKKLFSLLWELANGYWCALASGRSDAEARLGFGEHYAAQESDRVENNRRARQRRTFTYKGKPLQMMKHLKIGTKPGISETIRVHFEWDSTERLIIIGHCGRHLDQK